MDRRHDLHKPFRVDLPLSLQYREAARRVWTDVACKLPPAVVPLVGLAGFLTCGGAVIATAAAVALLV